MKSEKTRCLVCNNRNTDRCHIKTKRSGGTYDDFNIIYLCRLHHTEQHKIGIVTFAKKYSSVLKELHLKGWRIVNRFGIDKLERLDNDLVDETPTIKLSTTTDH